MLAPVLASALLLGSAPAANAQCFGPDGLDLGPCCAAVIPNLPQFPAASMPALGACWDRCTQGLQRTLKLSWSMPGQTACGEYSAGLFVADATSGLPMLTGKMILNYTRTWQEIDPAGNMTQVWRFTAKADLSTVPGGFVANCPTPPCLTPTGPHQTAFFYGYVDYATCSGTSTVWQNALVLNHAADRFIHAPGLSDKPGVFHPGQSYALIAPHSAVQTFIPGNNVAFGGPLIGEATRDVNVPGIPPAVCMTEDKVLAGVMVKLGAGCLANIAPNPKAHTMRQFLGQTACVNATGLPGNWASLNLFPTLPWFHMVTSSIGTWSNPNIYPGKETAWVDEGLFVQQDACTGDVIELKYGGSTQGGWTAILPVPPVLTNFTDIADNYTAPLLGPYPLPIMGSVRQTEHLIYVNEP